MAGRRNPSLAMARTSRTNWIRCRCPGRFRYRLSVIFALLLWFVSSAFLILISTTFSAADTNASRWEIVGETISLETIVMRPETVLASPDSFWANDEAYTLAKKWHENVGLPLDYDGYYDRWLERLQRLAAVPVEERRANPGFRMLEEIERRFPVYQERALPFLDRFLPSDAPTVASKIHITTGTLSFGFMTNGQIVIDPLSSHYKQDPDRVFNLITHETFHLGYGYNRDVRREKKLGDDFVYDTVLDGLQNEGIATYVGYRAREIFPNNAAST